MEFWKAILALLRRPRIGIPIALVAVVAAAVTFVLVPTHYVSRAFMVLSTPTSGGTLSQDPSKPTGLTNPLLNFNDGLKTTSGILIQALNTPDELAALGGGPKSSTTVTIDDGSTSPDLLSSSANGPFVYIEVEATSPQTTLNTVMKVQQKVRSELLDRQKALNAPPITYLTMVDVIPVSTPVTKATLKYQLTGVAFAMVLILGLGGVYSRDRIRETRRLKAPDDAGELAADPPTVRIAHHRGKTVVTVRNGSGLFSETLVQDPDSPHETV
jgi:hypothetical protein